MKNGSMTPALVLTTSLKQNKSYHSGPPAEILNRTTDVYTHSYYPWIELAAVSRADFMGSSD